MPSYTFTAYDVLQCNRDGKWLDFSTLRTTDDAQTAERLVARGEWEREPLEFRITDGHGNVKLARAS